MSDNRNTYLIVGKIGAPHGIKGWVKIYSLSHDTNTLMSYETWHVKSKDGWKVLETDARKQQGNYLLAHLVGIDDIDAARLLTNKQIAVLGNQLPETKKNEFYWTDLVGLTVITKQGEKLGHVDHMLETGANDVIVVSGNKRRLIPFVMEQIVLSIDLNKREIIVDWDISY